jgi:hypothetical protein
MGNMLHTVVLLSFDRMAEVKHASAPTGRSNIVVSEYVGESARVGFLSQAQSCLEAAGAAAEAEDGGRLHGPEVEAEHSLHGNNQ